MILELYNAIGLPARFVDDDIPKQFEKAVSKLESSVLLLSGSSIDCARAMSHYMRMKSEDCPIPVMASVTKLYGVWVASKTPNKGTSEEILRSVVRSSHLGLYHFDSASVSWLMSASSTFKMWFSDLIQGRFLEDAPTVVSIDPEFNLGKRLRHILGDLSKSPMNYEVLKVTNFYRGLR